MTTLAADAPMTRVMGPETSIPIIASDIVYESAMVGENGAGYGRPLVAGDKFVGHSMKKVDNASGSAGDKNIPCMGGGRYRLVVALVGLITDIDQPVYASDDGALTYAAGAGNSYVGVVKRYVSATTMEVEFRPGEQDEWGSRLRITKTDDYTLTAAESGKVVYLSTDTKTITVLATAEGLDFIVVNQAAAGAALIHVDPDGADLFLAGSGVAANADGEKFSNTKATQKRNDYFRFVYGGATGYRISGIRGTWAAE